MGKVYVYPERVNKIKNLLDKTFKQEFGEVDGQEIKTRRINEVLKKAHEFYKVMKSNDLTLKAEKDVNQYIQDTGVDVMAIGYKL